MVFDEFEEVVLDVKFYNDVDVFVRGFKDFVGFDDGVVVDSC